ncbi:MAG: YfcE family phosphodiesterase [Desulfurococcaceae archaeon]
MVRVLVIGDTHIPDRANDIPRALKEVIDSSMPWDAVVFTGDLTSESILKWIRSLSNRVYVVRGNMDYLPLPKTAIFEVEKCTIGVHHGDGFYPRGDVVRLTKIAHSLGVSVLISGHTHADFVKVGSTGKELLINPGSLTGVWGGGGGSYMPSFVVLEITRETIYITTYRAEGVYLKKSVHRATRTSNGGWTAEKLA